MRYISSKDLFNFLVSRLFLHPDKKHFKFKWGEITWSRRGGMFKILVKEGETVRRVVLKKIFNEFVCLESKRELRPSERQSIYLRILRSREFRRYRRVVVRLERQAAIFMEKLGL